MTEPQYVIYQPRYPAQFQEYRNPVHANTQNIGSWLTVRMTNDVLTFSNSDQIKGITPGGKRFNRFQDRESLIFSWRSGRLRVYRKVNARRQHNRYPIPASFRDVTANPPPSGLVYDQRIIPYLAERNPFGEPTTKRGDLRAVEMWQRIAYPMLREVPEWKPMTGVSRGLREHTVQGMTMTLFGKRRYRKDLVKAIAGAKTLDAVRWAYDLQRLVPLDWMIPVIAESSQRLNQSPLELFKDIDHNARRRLLTQFTGSRSLLIDDTLAMWKRIKQVDPMHTLGDYRVTNWIDLHDHLIREQNRIQRPNQNIPQSKLAKKIDGATSGDLTLVSAKETWELIDWGNTMNNCIGGYDLAALNGQSLLFAVMRDGALIGNMELDRNGRVRQLLGKHNTYLPEHDKVLAMLATA